MTEALSFASRLPASFEGAVSAAEWLHATAHEAGLPNKLVFAIEVCLEELFTNVARHGAPADGGQELEIALTLRVGDIVQLVLEDNAQVFDVTEAPAHGIEAPIEDVKPGGLGMTLLRQFSQSIQHDALPGGNRVTVNFLRDSSAVPIA